MEEGNYFRERFGSDYLDHEFVGEAVFELDGPACCPVLSTDMAGEEDPDEAFFRPCSLIFSRIWIAHAPGLGIMPLWFLAGLICMFKYTQ